MHEIPEWMNKPEWRDDPIWADQLRVLKELLGEKLTDRSVEGFRIIAGRFVDEFGNHRTGQLQEIFQTKVPAGVTALCRSLEAIQATLGSFERFEREYPVTINPSLPAFSMLPILGIETLASEIYRVVDSNSRARDESGNETKETILDYVLRTGCLPPSSKISGVVERSKPKGVHWCSYTAFNSPQETQEALQIWKSWNDCRIRFSLTTSSVAGAAFVPFNGDYPDVEKDVRVFDGYYFEPFAQDHPVDPPAGRLPLPGGGIQIAVFGAPAVSKVECWGTEKGTWITQEFPKIV